MWQMIWPVMAVVASNVVYNICQKSTPSEANAFGTLTVTYLVAALCTGILFFCTAHGGLTEQLKKLNWTSFVLGIGIVGLEIGYIFLFRAGWAVSTASLVCNIALAIALVFVGLLLYRETVSLKQVIGIAVCVVGVILLKK